MDAFSSGTVIQGYTVQGVIGAGGMGTVYRVLDATGKAFALKVVFRPASSDEATFEGRVTREANVARVIRHPGVVAVHAHGALGGGQRFLVMDLLEGRDLDQCIAEQSLSLEEHLSLLREALTTLAVAHSIVTLDGAGQPLVHRDLKPANLFVLEPPVDGVRLKIVDFGLVGQTSSTKLTRDGTGFGTPNYMAPEQFGDAHTATPATDVWAVAVMIYEAVSGVTPFDAATVPGIILKAIVGHPQRLDERVLGCPKGLARLVDECFDPEPTKRPRDATELAERLDLLLADPAVVAFARGRRALDPEGRAGRIATPRDLEGTPSADAWTTGGQLPPEPASRNAAPTPEVSPPTLPAWARGAIAFVAAALGYFLVRYLLAGS